MIWRLQEIRSLLPKSILVVSTTGMSEESVMLPARKKLQDRFAIISLRENY
jgi:hypothetical protein